jgi:hypothetical protein
MPSSPKIMPKNVKTLQKRRQTASFTDGKALKTSAA